MRARKKHQKRALGQMLGVVGGFTFAGLILLLHVWLPVQAQRSLIELKKWQQKLSEEKALFNELNERYIDLTSLGTLDHWADQNGPWRTPNEKDIFMIYE